MSKAQVNKTKKIFFTVLLITITALVMIPFLWMIILSFKSNNELYSSPFSLPKTFNFANYTRAMETINILKLYANTFYVAAISIAASLLVTFMSSFALSRMEFKRKKIKHTLYTYLLIGLTIPPFILLFPVYRLTVMLGLNGSFWALIMPYIATNISFNTLLFVGFFTALPAEIEEAAVMDGCGLTRLCVSIIAPVAKSVIATVFIFNVLYVWNEFPFASILLPKTEMYTLSMGASFFKGLYSVDYSGIIASSMLIIIPQLIFYGFFQKYIVEGMTAGAVKG